MPHDPVKDALGARIRDPCDLDALFALLLPPPPAPLRLAPCHCNLQL